MRTNYQIKLIILIVLLLLTHHPAVAEALTPPSIVVTQDRTTVSVAWSPVPSANGYRLFYAPYPYTGPDSTQSIDLDGGATSISAELWDGAAFYIAVTAHNDTASSDFSNIELFFLSTAPLLDADALPVTGTSWYKPPVSITWHWQLKGEVNTSYPAKLYDIDLFNSSAALINTLKASGKKVICYFSAGSYEDFREDKDKFKAAELGNALVDRLNERWLDIRSLNVAGIMISRLNLAALKGCDGVEPDNMDAYLNNSGFDLSARDQLAFNKFIANEAHKRGLSVGLKNNMEQIPELIDFFDFSVNEQCHEFHECNVLRGFIINGKPVLNAEYQQSYIDNPVEREALCNISNGIQFSTLILSRNLDDSLRFSCL